MVWMLRMDDEQVAKTVLQVKVVNTRRRGESRKNWMRAIEERTGIKLPRTTKLARDRYT